MNLNPLSWFRKKEVHPIPAPYCKSTGPQRRAEQRAKDAQRYVHVSKELTEVPEMLRPLFGGMRFIPVRKGTQYRSPKGVFRRESNRVAKMLGLSNKARRRCRSGMLRRLQEGAA